MPPVATSSDQPRSISAGDLAEARRLSRQLIGEREDGTRVALEEPAPLALGTDHGWDALLEECVRQIPAIAAFVVDDRGLLVAAAGALSPVLLEGTGARLALALRHLESAPATHATASTVIVEYEGEWLTGLRLSRDGRDLLLGVISDRPVTPTARGILRATFTAPT